MKLNFEVWRAEQFRAERVQIYFVNFITELCELVIRSNLYVPGLRVASFLLLLVMFCTFFIAAAAFPSTDS